MQEGDQMKGNTFSADRSVLSACNVTGVLDLVSIALGTRHESSPILPVEPAVLRLHEHLLEIFEARQTVLSPLIQPLMKVSPFAHHQ